MCNPLQELMNGISSIGNAAINTIEAVVRNPLPIIETIALTSMGIPPIIASATVSAVNGGNIQDIALSAFTAYSGAKLGDFAGSFIDAPLFENSGEASTTTGFSAETQDLLKKVVTSASGSAATSALRGQSFDQILSSAASGAIGSAVQNELKQSFNLDPSNLDSKLLTNSITAATKAILNGKSVGDAIAQSATATALSASISSGVDYLKQNSDSVQYFSNEFNKYKQTAQDFFNNQLNPAQANVNYQYNVASSANADFNNQKSALESSINQYNTYKNAVSSEDAYGNYLGTLGYITYADDYGVAYPRIDGQKLFQDARWVRDDDNQLYWQDAIYQPNYVYDAPSKQALANAANALVPQINDQSANLQNTYNFAKSAADAYTQSKSDFDNAQAQYKWYGDHLTNIKAQIDTLNAGITNQAEVTAQDVAKYEEFAATQAQDIAKQVADEAAKQAQDALTKTATDLGFKNYQDFQSAGGTAASDYYAPKTSSEDSIIKDLEDAGLTKKEPVLPTTEPTPDKTPTSTDLVSPETPAGGLPSVSEYETVPVKLPDGSVGSFDLSTGTAYNADGTVHANAPDTSGNPSVNVAGPTSFPTPYYDSNGLPSNLSNPFRVDIRGTGDSPDNSALNSVVSGTGEPINIDPNAVIVPSNDSTVKTVDLTNESDSTGGLPTTTPLEDAKNKITALIGLGGGDPTSSNRALFGGGAYIPGDFEAPFALVGWGTKEANEAQKYLEIVLNDPNSTPQDKSIAQTAIEKIKAAVPPETPATPEKPVVDQPNPITGALPVEVKPNVPAPITGGLPEPVQPKPIEPAPVEIPTPAPINPVKNITEPVIGGLPTENPTPTPVPPIPAPTPTEVPKPVLEPGGLPIKTPVPVPVQPTPDPVEAQKPIETPVVGGLPTQPAPDPTKGGLPVDTAPVKNTPEPTSPLPVVQPPVTPTTPEPVGGLPSTNPAPVNPTDTTAANNAAQAEAKAKADAQAQKSAQDAIDAKAASDAAASAAANSAAAAAAAATAQANATAAAQAKAAQDAAAAKAKADADAQAAANAKAAADAAAAKAEQDAQNNKAILDAQNAEIALAKKAADDAAAATAEVKGGLSTLGTTVASNDAATKAALADAAAKAAASDAATKTAFANLSDAQKIAAAKQAQDTGDLKGAIADVSKVATEGIAGVQSGLTTLTGTVGANQAANQTALADISNKVAASDLATQAKFASLTDAQKAAAAQQAKDTGDLQGSINAVAAASAAGIAEVKGGLSTLGTTVGTNQAENQAALTGLQTGLGTLGTTVASNQASTNQGLADVNKAVSNLGATTQAQYNSLTDAQKGLAAQQAKSTGDLTSAIADTAATAAAATAALALSSAAQTKNVSNQVSNLQAAQNAANQKPLDSSAQMLTSKVQPSSVAKLAELHQLYNSLTPEMKSVFAEKGIAPPVIKENILPSESTVQSDVTSAAGGGLISDETSKIIDSLTPKYISSKTLLESVAPQQQESRLSSLRHLLQGPLKNSMLSNRMSHGGLPQKYAQAAPEGHHPEFITGVTGYYAQGGGTGQSDDIPAMLHDGDYVMDADTVASLGDGSSKAGAEVLEKMRKQVPHHEQRSGTPVPAKIADGEYVFPASFVTAIGGGSNKLGSERLNEMREKIRAHKRSAPTTKIPPKAKSPLDYLKMAKG